MKFFASSLFFLLLGNSAFALGCNITVESNLNGNETIAWRDITKGPGSVYYRGSFSTHSESFEIKSDLNLRRDEFLISVLKDGKMYAKSYGAISRMPGTLVIYALDDTSPYSTFYVTCADDIRSGN